MHSLIKPVVHDFLSTSGNWRNVRILFLLLLVDLLLIVAHYMLKTDVLVNSAFAIDQDASYGEQFQYLKEFSIAALLFGLFTRTSKHIWLAWSLLFLYLLFDDSLRIHERVGGMVARTFHLQGASGLRPQDLGELIVTAAAAVLLFGFIAYSLLKPSVRERIFSAVLFVLVGILAGFGVMVDMLNMMIDWHPFLMTLIEDGGEQLAMSAIVWFVLQMCSRYAEQPRLTQSFSPKKQTASSVSTPDGNAANST